MVADTHWSDTEEVMNAMKMAMTINKTLTRYDLKFNNVSEDGIDVLVQDIIPNATHIADVELSNVVSEEKRAEFVAVLAANKPKKGGKGKKKKGKS